MVMWKQAWHISMGPHTVSILSGNVSVSCLVMFLFLVMMAVEVCGGLCTPASKDSLVLC